VPEGEWKQFTEALKKPLPITFRVNGSGRYANELRETLETDFFAKFSKGPIIVSGRLHGAVCRMLGPSRATVVATAGSGLVLKLYLMQCWAWHGWSGRC
jgi:hypothetical protein